MGASQKPDRPAGGLPPSDRQPSPRIAAAVSMLRRGHHPAQVAAVTDVPFALVVPCIAARWPATALDPGTSAGSGQGVIGQTAARRGVQPAWSTRSSRPALTHASTRDRTGPALSTNALFRPRGG
jgi:hypothetical protein